MRILAFQLRVFGCAHGAAGLGHFPSLEVETRKFAQGCHCCCRHGESAAAAAGVVVVVVVLVLVVVVVDRHDGAKLMMVA